MAVTGRAIHMHAKNMPEVKASQDRSSIQHRFNRILEENAIASDVLRAIRAVRFLVFHGGQKRYTMTMNRSPADDQPIRIVELRQKGSQAQLVLSDGSSPLTVSDELVYRHRLKEGIVLTRPQVEQLTAEAQRYECEKYASRLLAIRDHSEGELATKLKAKGFTREMLGKTLDRLRERGLVDDAHFAHNLVCRLIERNPSGRSFLVAHLVRKKIDRSLAVQTVNAALEGKDELELAIKALQRRWRLYCQLNLETARVRAYTYLGRRGISYEAARSAFEHLSSTTE